MKISFTLFLLIVVHTTTFSQVSKIDVQVATVSSDPQGFVVSGGKLFFTANTSIGRELYVTDGSAAGTKLVKDIGPGLQSGILRLRKHIKPVDFNNALYFSANDAINGTELWMTGGDTENTVMVKDINPTSRFSDPSNFTVSGSSLFFLANDGVHGRELWKTDGTGDGTLLVKDIFPGAQSAFIDSLAFLTDVGGTLYFVANDGTNGYEIWKSDGTEDGTALVKNIIAADATGTIRPTDLYNFNGMLVFAAADPIKGTELWKSDGTEAGTVMIADINTAGNSSPTNLYASGEVLYFSASTPAVGRELWKTDGTEAGTTMVQDIIPGIESSSPASMIRFGAHIFFEARNPTFAHTKALWSTDGTVAKAVLTCDLLAAIADLELFNNQLFVTADLYRLGTTLYVLETPVATPTPVIPYAVERNRKHSFAPRFYPNLPKLIPYRDNLYFPAIDHRGQELWRTNGDKLEILKDVNTTVIPASITQLVATNNDFYFRTSVNQLFQYNPSSEALHFVDAYADLHNLRSAGDEIYYYGFADVSPPMLFNGNNWLFRFSPSLFSPVPIDENLNEIVPGLAITDTAVYYNVRQGGYHNDLRVYNRIDGSFSNVSQLDCSMPGRCSGIPSETQAYGDYLYFINDQVVSLGDRGYYYISRIYRTDGKVSRIYGGTGGDGSAAIIRNLTIANDMLIFSGENHLVGKELMRLADEPGPAVLVKDINATDKGSSAPESLTAFNNKLFFSANDGIHGRELWVSDGTPQGTSMIVDLMKGVASSGPVNLFSTARGLFFVASDEIHGAELWVTDGTAIGTRLVKDVFPGPSSSSITSMYTINGRVFFSANDGVHGTELWKTDGTTEGTYMIADVNPGNNSSNPKLLASPTDDKLYFIAEETTGVEQLWRYDFEDEISTSSELILCHHGGTLYFETTQVFDENNVFSLELSDNTGSFSNPTTIGTLAGPVHGNIPYAFPEGVSISNAHRVRIKSSGPESILTGVSYGLRIISLQPDVMQVSTDSGMLVTTSILYAHYAWTSASDSLLSTDANLLVTQTGAYTVSVREETCVATSAPFNVLVVGNDTDASRLIDIYPNPARDVIMITINEQASPQSITLYNSLGIKVMSVLVNGKSSIEIPLTNVKQGVYILRFDSRSGDVVKKVIKQ